ncbi:MAG TPA: DinB family protein [Streptosporangiaceae bacterium]
MTTTQTATGERADLLASLDRHRDFLRQTTRGLTDEQAAERSTVSQLCLGGLIKHVALTERQWVRFILEGPSAMTFDGSPEAIAMWQDMHRMTEGETLAGLLAQYDRIAAETDELVRTLPDLDASHPLPQAPWFEPGAAWSARRVLLHIIAETSQHAGHADIIREAIDGAKTMG